MHPVRRLAQKRVRRGSDRGAGVFLWGTPGAVSRTSPVGFDSRVANPTPNNGKQTVAVSGSILTDWLSALERVTGKASRRSGDEYRSPCPAHGGKDYNLSVTERDGRVLTTCHSHGCEHEDIRAAVFRVNGSPYRDRDRPLVVSPGPDREWHYYKTDGSLHLTVIRSNAPNGKHIHREPSGVKPPHPIYAVREVLERQNDPVLVVESEKAADAAAERFTGYVVTTSCGGSKQAKQSDWTPLTDRKVVIWPDADEAGATYAGDVDALAWKAGAADVRIVDLPDGLPKGWDLAVPVPDGVEVERILESRPMLNAIRLDALLEMPDPKIQWLVRDILPAVGSSVLGGGKGVGKSTAARSLGGSVADGKEWLGRETAPGTVLYVAREDGFLTIKRHFAAMRLQHPERLHVVLDPPNHRDRLMLLRGSIHAINPALVIVDTLFRYVEIEDGNAYSETTAAIEPYVTLARANQLHLMFTHHARKSGGERGHDILGSVGLIAMADTVVSLSMENDRRHFAAFGRDGVEIEKTVLNMDTSGCVTAAGTKHQADVRNVMREVLDFIGESPEPVSGPEVREGVSRGKPVVREALNNLVADGDLEQTGNGPTVRYSAIGTSTQI